MNENKNASYQNLQDAAKVELEGKYIPVNAYNKSFQTTPPPQIRNTTIIYHITLFQCLRLSFLCLCCVSLH